MIEFRQLFWILTLSTFLLMTTGCTTNRWIPINEELEREGSGLPKESGQTITAYQLNDGPRIVDFKGQVKLAAPDSLYFWTEKWVPFLTKKRTPGPRFTLNEVKALKVQMGSPEKTVTAVIFGIGGIALVVVGSQLPNFD